MTITVLNLTEEWARITRRTGICAPLGLQCKLSRWGLVLRLGARSLRIERDFRPVATYWLSPTGRVIQQHGGDIRK